MLNDKLVYFERRVRQASDCAAKTDGIVKATHLKFVAAYQEQLAQFRRPSATVDELLG